MNSELFAYLNSGDGPMSLTSRDLKEISKVKLIPDEVIRPVPSKSMAICIANCSKIAIELVINGDASRIDGWEHTALVVCDLIDRKDPDVFIILEKHIKLFEQKHPELSTDPLLNYLISKCKRADQYDYPGDGLKNNLVYFLKEIAKMK